MRKLQWAFTTILAMAAVGCSSSSDTDDVATSSSAALEGAYYAERGPVRWSSFKGNEYVLWSGEAACDLATATAEACATHGTFALDAAHDALTLTEAPSGRVTTLHIRIDGITPRGSLVGPSSLVENGGQLLAPNVVSGFSLAKPGEQLTQEASLRTFAIVCRVVGLILQPPTQPVIVPQIPVITAPAPVQQQQCSS